MENPLEGKKVTIPEGICLVPHCLECGASGFGFYIVEQGKTFDEELVEDACCIECASANLEWKIDSWSEAKTILEEGWKAGGR